MATRTKKAPMSDTHKEALAEGRNHARIVGRYLEALEANKPRRGRKRTADSVKKRLTTVGAELDDATGLTRLNLLQERRDLEVELATMQAGAPDLSGLEKDFVKVAKSYSTKKKISYGAWREFGVPSETLKKAGISRSA
jgi:hypothetical protein